jgi:hypothetical protein
MVTVEVPVPAEKVNALMRTMREWLDSMRFDPSNFTCREIGGRFVARVRFEVAEEAVAFAEHFEGRVL